jgi:hypothetical protein
MIFWHSQDSFMAAPFPMRLSESHNRSYNILMRFLGGNIVIGVFR